MYYLDLLPKEIIQNVSIHLDTIDRLLLQISSPMLNFYNLDLTLTKEDVIKERLRNKCLRIENPTPKQCSFIKEKGIIDLFDIYKNDKIELFNFLLNGEKINFQQMVDGLSLIIASSFNSIGIVKKLIDLGADIHFKHFGFNALDFAIIFSSIDSLELLLKAGGKKKSRQECTSFYHLHPLNKTARFLLLQYNMEYNDYYICDCRDSIYTVCEIISGYYSSRF